MTKKKIVKKPAAPALSQRGLLVQVTLRQWGARKLDKQATETVVKTHQTDTTAGGYTKKLLPNAAELQAVNLAAGQIRKYFHDNTLPWMSDGSRIISAKNHLKFMTEIRKMVAEFETHAKNFEDAYPSLQAQAQKTLGGLYRPGEYPSHAEIRGKFKCEVNVMPLPDVKDFRVEVSEAEKKQFVAKMKEVESEAMKSVYDRVQNVVRAAAEKLAEPDAVFRNSLLENVKEMCAILPALNISEDPKLEATRKELEKLVAGYDVENLRTDKTERSDAAKRLKAVQDKMAAFAGAYAK